MRFSGFIPALVLRTHGMSALGGRKRMDRAVCAPLMPVFEGTE